jgi:hypothetical protein
MSAAFGADLDPTRSDAAFSSRSAPSPKPTSFSTSKKPWSTVSDARLTLWIGAIAKMAKQPCNPGIEFPNCKVDGANPRRELRASARLTHNGLAPA